MKLLGEVCKEKKKMVLIQFLEDEFSKTKIHSISWMTYDIIQ